ncbi:MAG: hypothetical protein FWE47_00670 [Oscillospiraceae bacterium]|nr:hypothetical protein [Oscillospiraceae bacterium]
MDYITPKQLKIVTRLLGQIAEIKIKKIGKLSIISAISEKEKCGRFKEIHLVLKGYMVIKKFTLSPYLNNFPHNCKVFEKEMKRKFNKGEIF